MRDSRAEFMTNLLFFTSFECEDTDEGIEDGGMEGGRLREKEGMGRCKEGRKRKDGWIQ